MLYYSSLLLSLIIIVAYRLHITYVHHLFLISLSTSLIHHSKYNEKYYGKRMIAYVDRTVGHITYIILMMVVLNMNQWNYFIRIYWSCAVLVIAIYYGYGTSRKDDLLSDKVHAIMHLLITIGTISMLYGVYGDNNLVPKY